MRVAVAVVVLASLLSVGSAQCVVKKAFGCYTAGGTQLTYVSTSVNMDMAMCAEVCNSLSQVTAAVQSGSQCYCGAGTPTQPKVDNSMCNVPCAGDTAMNCGGSNTFYAYQYTCSGYSCTINTCKLQEGGTFPSATCGGNCNLVHYDCVSGQCKPVSQGAYASSACNGACKATYGCQGGACLFLPGGQYQSSTCGGQCHSSSSSSSSKLAAGSVLLIVFFCGLVVPYFVGGFLFMHYSRGKSGREAIPNVDFWAALPSLIADGFRFVISKITSNQAQYSQL